MAGHGQPQAVAGRPAVGCARQRKRKRVDLVRRERLRGAVRLSDKPLMEAAHGREITADNLALARGVFGDDLGAGGGPAAEVSAVIGDVINVSSPLRFDQRMLGGLTASFEKFILDLEDLARFTEFLGRPDCDRPRPAERGAGAASSPWAGRHWRDWLREYEPPPLEPAVAEALDDYVARRERELAGRNLCE